MIETSLPRWSVRLDAHRKHGFTDLIPILAAHYRLHESIENFLGPYNARQRSSKYPYQAPDKDIVRQLVKQGGVNDFTYQAMLNSVVRFCEQHKGLRAVPNSHPSTIHNIQLPTPAFQLEADGPGKFNVHVIGAEEPLSVGALRNPDEIKFIIVRPKLSQLGTASAKNWEILFFKQALGYVPEWADSQLNPKYSGKL